MQNSNEQGFLKSIYCQGHHIFHFESSGQVDQYIYQACFADKHLYFSLAIDLFDLNFKRSCIDSLVNCHLKISFLEKKFTTTSCTFILSKSDFFFFTIFTKTQLYNNKIIATTTRSSLLKLFLKVGAPQK